MMRNAYIDRRTFIHGFAAAAVCGRLSTAQADEPRGVTGKGDIETPAFYRHDLGFSSGRLHEPSADPDGNLWFSPLDGRLMRYHAASGHLEILNLADITGRDWNGLHLWPIAAGGEVYLCCPKLDELWSYDPAARQVSRFPFPHPQPQVYGGFVVGDAAYLYDIGRAAVIDWDVAAHRGVHCPCPYPLSGTLYMTFADPGRKELWGSTYTGNDLVRFDIPRNEWSGHWKSPLEKATPTPANGVFNGTLFVSDHLNGRLLPFHVETGDWGEPMGIPGFGEWFGYVGGGGVVFRGLVYLCHSTWTGGNGSIDGRPHRFLGSWSVFDPVSRGFSRLDIPVREGESFISAYGYVAGDDLFISAVNANPPQNAVMLRSSRWTG